MLINEATRQKFAELHKALLRLHKILLEDERKEYEKLYGRVDTSGQLLQLVMYDPWFDWLHRISETVVKIDETMESDEAGLEEALDILSALRLLFRGNDESPFMLRYKACLQREPGAVLAHIDVQKLLSTDA